VEFALPFLLDFGTFEIIDRSIMDYPAEEPTHITFERLSDLKNWQGFLLSLDLFREPNDEEQKHEAWLEQRFSSTVNRQKELLHILVEHCSVSLMDTRSNPIY